MNHLWSVARILCGFICLASVATLYAEDKADDGLTLRLKLNKGDSRVATCRLVKQGATEAETESIDADIQMTVLDVPAPAQYKLGCALVRVKAKIPNFETTVITAFDVDSASPTFATKFPALNALHTLPIWAECDDHGKPTDKRSDFGEVEKLLRDRENKNVDPNHLLAFTDILKIFSARLFVFEFPEKSLKIGDVIQAPFPIQEGREELQLNLILRKREKGLVFFDTTLATKKLEKVPFEGTGQLTIEESTGCVHQFEFSMKPQTTDLKIPFKEIRLSVTVKDSKK